MHELEMEVPSSNSVEKLHSRMERNQIIPQSQSIQLFIQNELENSILKPLVKYIKGDISSVLHNNDLRAYKCSDNENKSKNKEIGLYQTPPALQNKDTILIEGENSYASLIILIANIQFIYRTIKTLLKNF